MHVVTVEGDKPVKSLGVTLTHEHLFLDFDWPGLWPDVSGNPEIIWEPLSMNNLGPVRRNYMAVRDNARLDNLELAAQELSYFKAAGGGTVVDVTPLGLAGRPDLLPKLSQMTGVQLIAGTALYIDDALTDQIRSMTIADIQALYLHNIREGFEGTNVKAGHIGEVALSSPIHPIEERDLRASSRVQKETGLSVSVHIGLDPELIAEAIRILEEEHANLSRYIFDHVDSAGPVEAYLPMLDHGITLSFDTFGHEFYCDNGAYDGPWPWCFPRDSERALGVKSLVERGYADQIVLSHDICVKMQLRTYGGFGYAHVLENVRPMLEHMGVGPDAFRKMVMDNPARLLAVEE